MTQRAQPRSSYRCRPCVFTHLMLNMCTHTHPWLAICHLKVTKKKKKKSRRVLLYFFQLDAQLELLVTRCATQWRISLSLEEEVKLLLDTGFKSELWWARGRAVHHSQLLSSLPIVSHSLPVITRPYPCRGTNKGGYLTPKMTFSDNSYLIQTFF